MTKAITNYDKTKISMAQVFLRYDQVAMIHNALVNIFWTQNYKNYSVTA